MAEYSFPVAIGDIVIAWVEDEEHIVDRIPYEDALEKARGDYSTQTVRSAYRKIKSVMTDYAISHRGEA